MVVVSGKDEFKVFEDEVYDVEMDEDFVVAFEYGMFSIAGMGFGVDRFVMFFMNLLLICDVIVFLFFKK